MDRRSLLIGAGLTVFAGVSAWRAPKSFVPAISQGQFRAAIPERVGGWRSRKTAELVLPPQDGSNELYENLETRIYEATGLPAIMVLVAYSRVQQNDIQVHRPEICYPASGYPIVSSKPIELEIEGKTIAARAVAADRGGLVERVIYWVRVGEAYPTDWTSQRLAMAKANLLGQVPDGVLVRISAIEEPGNDVARQLLGFISSFVAGSSLRMKEQILL